MVTNLELEQAGLNETEREHFWKHRQGARTYSKFFAERQGLKDAITTTLTDLDNIINKTIWTNAEAIDSIKKEAQLLKHIINFLKNDAL